MTTKLWQPDSAPALHPTIEAYTVGTDQLLDQRLLGYDITATKAHAHMLAAIGVLSTDEYDKLSKSLDKLYSDWQSGAFALGPEHEDGHTAIELYLTDQLGHIGKKVHTGRSRNDQALVMMRLYLKDQLENVAALLDKLVTAYTETSNTIGSQPMPGYTHTQKAMPTTVAVWLGSYHDAFQDMKAYVESSFAVIDQNPLGSAAGFGTTLALDRTMTTTELGFNKTQENPMYCGISRGIFELVAVQALVPVMTYAGKFATDMLLFTAQEFNFFTLPASMTTGSSIMPHKRNYDVYEIMRATAHGFAAYPMQLQAIASGAGSGYHRDLQFTKGITLKAFDECLATLETLALTVTNLQANPEQLNAAMTEELYTVAAINKLVEQGMPFRDAYLEVKKTI